MGTYEQIKADFLEALKPKEGVKGYDTEAEVVRIDGSTAWVHIPGGVDETPVAMTVNAKAGDSVRIRVSGGSAWITGSDSAPPTDDRMANIANTRAVEANTRAASAEEAAENAEQAATGAYAAAATAQQIAADTAQHFWVTDEGTDTGAHITELTQEEFEANPDGGGANLLARSNGIAVRNGLTELASFGTVIQLGNGASYMRIDPSGFGVTFDGGVSEAIAAHLYNGGTAPDSDSASNISLPRNTAAIIHLPNTLAMGTTITLVVSMVYNSQTITSTVTFTAGTDASVELWDYGYGCLVVSHSGYSCHITNRYFSTMVVGYTANYYIQTDRSAYFTFGERTGSNIGKYSIAEGYQVYAGGDYSHAQNVGTVALSDSQTALGKYNYYDAISYYAVIVGNGTAENARSNALGVRWNGEVTLAIDTTLGAGTTDGDLYAALVSLGWDSDVIF